ncbi:4-amino-4-deoxy-L-arabinose transferase-like glycosyltransferase [Lysobacter sp. HA35]
MTHEAGAPRRAVAWVLGLTALLRLAHLYFAIRSPLTYQPGPDEAYYIAFGHDVASGSGGLQPIFAFMDPFYGYLVGAVLRVTGSLFPIYLLQIALDTLTAYGLYRIAGELGRPRTGLVAAAIYALTGTAIAYTAAILKPTCDVAYLTWWSFALLGLMQQPTPRRWALFGAYCGLGVAIRSNLLLMTPLAVAVVFACSVEARRRWVHGVSFLIAGLALPLALLVARNHAISGNWSPLPNNGGIVLHQLYNDENPQSRSGVPSFVGRYTAPFEIWRGYEREAQRRAGHSLRPNEVSAYWQHEATSYLFAHPWQSMANGIRKLREFSAYPEVPNTRSYGDERCFSPVLRALPLPFGWLFALGLPGLVLWLRRDRRALVLLAPVAMGLLTIAVFFAEDRFRFDFIGPFVLGSACWLVFLFDALRRRDVRELAFGIVVSGLLGAWSAIQARQLIPAFPSGLAARHLGVPALGARTGSRSRAASRRSAIARRERPARTASLHRAPERPPGHRPAPSATRTGAAAGSRCDMAELQSRARATWTRGGITAGRSARCRARPYGGSYAASWGPAGSAGAAATGASELGTCRGACSVAGRGSRDTQASGGKEPPRRERRSASHRSDELTLCVTHDFRSSEQA